MLDTEHCSIIKLWNHGSLATELQKRKWRVFNILFFLQETNESWLVFILPVHERLASQILKWVTKQPGCNLNLYTLSVTTHTHFIRARICEPCDLSRSILGHLSQMHTGSKSVFHASMKNCPPIASPTMWGNLMDGSRKFNGWDFFYNCSQGIFWIRFRIIVFASTF